MKKRLDYLDALRVFAIYTIVMMHFITFACPRYFTEKGMLPVSLVKGMNGEAAVMLFCVLLGFFASKTKLRAEQYIVKRFLQFTVIPFVIYCFLYAFSLVSQRVFGADLAMPEFTQFNGNHVWQNLRYIIGNTVMLQTDVLLQVLWCLQPFFYASAAIYLMAKLFRPKGWKIELLAAVGASLLLFMADSYNRWGTQRWVAFCFVGYVGYLLFQCDFAIFRKQAVAYPLALGSAVAFSCMPLGAWWLALQSVLLCVFVLACTGAPGVQKVLSIPPLPWLGKITFHIYMWHMVAMHTVFEVMRYIGGDPFTYLWNYLFWYGLVTLMMSTISYYAYDVFFTKWVVNPLLAKVGAAEQSVKQTTASY